MLRKSSVTLQRGVAGRSATYSHCSYIVSVEQAQGSSSVSIRKCHARTAIIIGVHREYSHAQNIGFAPTQGSREVGLVV